MNLESPTWLGLGFDQVHENQAGHVQQPVPGPSADPHIDWKHWTDLVNRPSLERFGQAHENQAGPSTDANFDDEMTSDELRPPPLKRPKLASSIVFGQTQEHFRTQERLLTQERLIQDPPTQDCR
jgi:hypothetical protein